MNRKHHENQSVPSFHPSFCGCIAHDLKTARAAEELYLEELYAVSAYTYRSLLYGHSDLFRDISMDEMRHFRLLGELILALGGNPVIRAQIRVDVCELDRGEACASPRGIRQMLNDSIREEKRAVDRYQSLMGCTDDRIVRSVLLGIIEDEQRHVEWLSAALVKE